MFFQKNTQALLKARPQYQNFVNSLAKVEPALEFELLETAQGDYTLYYKGTFLHDPQGAKQEAENVAKKHCHKESEQVHILLVLVWATFCRKSLPIIKGILLFMAGLTFAPLCFG
jgi:hypothetical protein